jgi:hypothetical protein
MTIARTIIAGSLALGLLGFGCDIDRTDDGRYVVEPAEVEIGQERREVTLPTVDIIDPDEGEVREDTQGKEE